MNNVYVLVEERENSVACRIHGIWSNREMACKEMLKMIESNILFSERSRVSLEEGSAESDPEYCDDEYCNYSVDEYQIK